MDKGANKRPRNPPSCFYILCFTVLIALSINTPESLNDFMILIILFRSSFGICKSSSFPLTFLSKLFIAFEAKLLIYPGKLPLAKGIAIFD